MEGSGNGAFFYRAPKAEPKAPSKGGLGQCVYWTRLLSINRVVNGLLFGHNALKRHPYVMDLIDSPLFRKCGAEEVTSFYVLCECEALATFGKVFGFLFSWTLRKLEAWGQSGTLKGQRYNYLGIS